MKEFLRPYWSFGVVLLMWALAMGTQAQVQGVAKLPDEPHMLPSSSSQGYLGVNLADVDQKAAQALKLKEIRGAVITLIDHDAPAGEIGLRVNDVVLKLNGQTVEGTEQLRRMLREIPAGRKVTLEISRDGNLQSFAVELADRRVMEHDVWNKLGADGEIYAPGPGAWEMGGTSPPGSFHLPFFGLPNVGAVVEPLTKQMAEFLGVPGGVMVKEVTRNSEAAAAGMKAFDVILKVGSNTIKTQTDWERVLRAYQGKQTQVIVLRDKKQQTLTLQVDSKRHSF